MSKELQMIDGIAAPNGAGRAQVVQQDCGPVTHFTEQDRAGALHSLWRCARCGHVNQPFSSQQAALMRRAAKLRNGTAARTAFSPSLYEAVTSR